MYGISFLFQIDFIIVLVDGQVFEMGFYLVLLQCNGFFVNFFYNYVFDEDQYLEDSWIVLEGVEDNEVLLIEDIFSNYMDLIDSDLVIYVVQKQFMRQLSVLLLDGEGQGQFVFWRCLGLLEKVWVIEVKVDGVLIQKEKVEIGIVELSVFWDYVKVVGFCIILVICFLYVG